MTVRPLEHPLDRPRVLHLGYEDPRKPGAGGGSVRTQETNSRLAEHFDITVATATFPGCEPYQADGVRYRHLGTGGPRNRSYLASVASYFSSLPVTVRRWRPDLIIEDFGAPISTIGLPTFTRTPVIGLVQWLFAEEKSRQYKVRVHDIERWGVARHRRLISVSDDLATRLRALSPHAQVDVVPNGLPDAAFHHELGRGGGGLRYLGRVEDAQKGISLLLRAFAKVADQVPLDLRIAGTGPDEDEMRRLCGQLGIGDRVHFVGQVRLEDRFDWLAAADVVVMPSRYETFGMVAAEALAVGVPVVAFDIDCLRGLVNNDNGRRVAAFDVEAYAAALVELGTDHQLRQRLAANARPSVRHLTWDAAAMAQAELYRQALAARAAR